MTRKSRCILLILGLVLFLLPLSGCGPSGSVPEQTVVSGRVVLGEDQTTGLAGVSLLIVDEEGSQVETDAEGYYKTTALSTALIIPRKTGFKFTPEQQGVGEKQELKFLALPWEETDFSNWGTQFSFASHSDRVGAIAFSPGDQYIASGSDDRTIRIWRANDGQIVRTMTGHTSAIKAMAFSPQGQYLASGAKDGGIIIWNWETGQEVIALTGHTDLITDLEWSPDGTKLASSGWDKKIRVWDFATGSEIRSFSNKSWVRTVAWSQDGRFLFSGGNDSNLRVWQL